MSDRPMRVEWSSHFTRAVADEIRSGVRTGAITWAEADQLLARVRVLVDQALDVAPVAG